uniref:Ig-like domain-containing protein n=1 Tax=Astyanax mexicanus TaxID=7994 RepID=W5LSH8_ASTMX
VDKKIYGSHSVNKLKGHVIVAILYKNVFVLYPVVVTQSAAKSVQPGDSVSIDCKFNTVVYRNEQGTSSKGRYYTSWYLQKAGEEPKLLIYYSDERFSGVSSKFSGGGGNKIDYTLTITGVQPEDSGVYYCQSQHFLNSTFSVYVFTHWNQEYVSLCEWENKQRRHNMRCVSN